MITFKTPKHHWNYFLAIEKDLENLSRYIEFTEDNLKAYSIELTHILLSASSEVDVVMKQLCALIAPTQPANNIDNYRNIVKTHLTDFIDEEIFIDRFELTFQPWENWKGNNNPDWWRSHNNVKHQRNDHFKEANLKNAINAVGALLLTVVYYYKFAFSHESGAQIDIRKTTPQLQPDASIMRMNSRYYPRYLVY